MCLGQSQVSRACIYLHLNSNVFMKQRKEKRPGWRCSSVVAECVPCILKGGMKRGRERGGKEGGEEGRKEGGSKEGKTEEGRDY